MLLLGSQEVFSQQSMQENPSFAMTLLETFSEGEIDDETLINLLGMKIYYCLKIFNNIIFF